MSIVYDKFSKNFLKKRMQAHAAQACATINRGAHRRKAFPTLRRRVRVMSGILFGAFGTRINDKAAP